MKILILSDINAGGEWIATQTLIEQLIEEDRRIEFYLINSSKTKNLLLKRFLFKKIFSIKHKYYKKPFKYYRELFYELFSGKNAISYICKGNKFDHIIITNYTLAISYLISQKKLDYIYFFHGVRNNFKIFSETFNHYMVFKKLLEIFAWTMSKKLIVPSIFAKEYLIKNSFSLFKKVSPIIIPNLIRDEFKKALKVRDKTIVLYSGRLDSNKGVENLIKAFLLLTKKLSNIVLVIVYLGKPKIELVKKIKVFMGTRADINFFYNLSVEKLSLIYRSSTLAVLPSPFEISSLFIREAIMCNLPIVTTNTGDAEKILPGSFILPDNKINTIYRYMDNFFTNESEYKKKFLKISNVFKHQYSKEKIINSWIKLLK